LEQRRLDRRQRLAEAALELFSERGFDHTSVDDVVGLARTSKSAFYEFWSSREDCLRWLLDRLGERLVALVQFDALEAGSPRERLRRGLAGFVEGCVSDQRLARLLLVESVGFGGDVEAARRRIQDRFARMVEAEVRDEGGLFDRRLTGVDAVVFGRAVVGATQEATAKLITEPAADPDTVIRGLCAIFAPFAVTEAP
jgi:AcrR family transcriptional regulator